MSDRLTQLQLCFDQLVEQFNATFNYVNNCSVPGILGDDANSVFNLAASAPLPNQQGPQESIEGSNKNTHGENSMSTGPTNEATEANFDNTLNELSTDIVLKSRQIDMLIDSLPGIDVSQERQIASISELMEELKQIERVRENKIEEKDRLVDWCEMLIKEVSSGMAGARG